MSDLLYKALYLSPMIPSYDLTATASFFTDLLGFTLIFNSGGYMILEKDELTVHLLNAGEDIGQMEFYLEVDDVDTLWDSINDKIEGLKVRPPFDREYNMREIHIEVPHTKTLLFIGKSI